MDDTLWIAQSFQQLQQIIQTASLFYQLTNIKVNSQKLVLISNTKKSYSITFLNSSIQTQPLHTSFKFLGAGLLPIPKHILKLN